MTTLAAQMVLAFIGFLTMLFTGTVDKRGSLPTKVAFALGAVATIPFLATLVLTAVLGI